MQRTILGLGLASIALLSLAPQVLATNYNICTPGNAVCIIQYDSPWGGPDCDTYAWRYAVNSDKNEVVVNTAAVSATAGAQNMCANYFYNDADYQGFYATGAAAGTTLNFGWYSYDVDYHWPGAPQDIHGEYITLTTNSGSGQTGFMWRRTITPAAGTDACDMTVYAQGSPTSLGCPASTPPPPPPGPWGHLLP